MEGEVVIRLDSVRKGRQKLKGVIGGNRVRITQLLKLLNLKDRSYLREDIKIYSEKNSLFYNEAILVLFLLGKLSKEEVLSCFEYLEDLINFYKDISFLDTGKLIRLSRNMLELDVIKVNINKLKSEVSSFISEGLPIDLDYLYSVWTKYYHDMNERNENGDFLPLTEIDEVGNTILESIINSVIGSSNLNSGKLLRLYQLLFTEINSDVLNSLSKIFVEDLGYVDNIHQLEFDLVIHIETLLSQEVLDIAKINDFWKGILKSLDYPSDCGLILFALKRIGGLNIDDFNKQKPSSNVIRPNFGKK